MSEAARLMSQSHISS